METILYDFTSLEEVTGGDQTIKDTIIQLFLTTVPDDLKAIENALESKNYAQVSSIAHKIKPSINYVCMKPLFDDIITIEKWENDSDSMTQRTLQFISTIRIVLKQLSKL